MKEAVVGCHKRGKFEKAICLGSAPVSPRDMTSRAADIGSQGRHRDCAASALPGAMRRWRRHNKGAFALGFDSSVIFCTTQK
jgi:hypothetical protein